MSLEKSHPYYTNLLLFDIREIILLFLKLQPQLLKALLRILTT